MLRNTNLVPLSHQHQHALALCVRIQRASPIADADSAAWQAEITQMFQAEIRIHFAAEEQVLFPAARQFSDLVALVDELCSDHVWLCEHFSGVVTQGAAASNFVELAQKMSEHIRKEERHLFERMQELMSPEELTLLGRKLEEALEGATQACVLPTDATRLRSAK